MIKVNKRASRGSDSNKKWIAKQIIGPARITQSFGYPPKQLRFDGTRQPLTEMRVLADLVMAVNDMSGQLND